MAPESVEKTAFACHAGIFEWVRMPMGVACGPPVFQREMQRTLAGLVGVCALVYLDDLIIYSKDMSTHLVHLTEVFAHLRGADLTLKREKCRFATNKVELLGYIISPEGIQANSDKVSAIAELPHPTNVKEVQRFLGMCGYFRQTIQNYAHIAAPMVSLTKKKNPWLWGDPEKSILKI